MPSVVDICNLALGHLGDEANVESIEPPDGSAQAAHCARFYPIARDSLLELHDWNFASTRQALSLLASTPAQWGYAYAAPNKMIAARKVIDAAAIDDWGGGSNGAYGECAENGWVQPYAGQRYVVETDVTTGAKVILTNQPNALLIFTRSITDPTKFSPLFIDVLGYLLASKLAGPIIKGSEGRSVGAQMLQAALGFLSSAKASDANQRRVDVTASVPWIVGR